MTKKILVTGSSGVLGSAIMIQLKRDNSEAELFSPTSSELDLLDRKKTSQYFEHCRPDEVYHLASLVYGLQGNLDNQWRAIHLNTMMNDNVFNACLQTKTKKIFFASTVAAYPDNCPNPLTEKDLFNGLPHWGEFGYAFAKRHAYGYLEILKNKFDIDFVYGLFTNIYGPNDRFNVKTGHVIPSLLYKAYESVKSKSKKLEIWGNPETTRDFIYSYDAAGAAVFSMKETSGMVNIASGREIKIGEVVDIILDIFPGLEPCWVNRTLVGINRRSVDISVLRNKGWTPNITIREGLEYTVQWMREHEHRLRM